ncbi:MAG: CDP-glycerol glycerophosphotransferase family protein [Lachnospiraceae bacterium]|nr:CDP-glycerol glycerophosphotransferase family protein [Lachnospiraceae bacterium]
MFQIKQLIKMLLQNIILPFVYRLYCRRPVEDGLVLFADAHHASLPFSMRRMYEAVKGLEEGREKEDQSDSPSDGRPEGRTAGSKKKLSQKVHIETFVTDFDRLSFFAMAGWLLRFMRRYAAAEYVFICDYFLPVSSCRKRPETKVVQLWHSCGLMKKIAYDATEDIPKGYRGNLFGNYTYLTLSAEVCVPVHAHALRLPQDHIFATGVSRTDFYFDKEWNQKCREHFFREHPEAAGKRIAVWAPTFRGNAALPRLEGLDAVLQASKELTEKWFFVIKAHPHIDRHGKISNSEIPTEELLPVADVLVTDYSSLLFDWLLYRKPTILFAPDLEEYESARGFYIDYRSIPFPLAQSEEELRAIFTQSEEGQGISPARGGEPEGGAVESTGQSGDADEFRKTYVGTCDGHATERILKLAGLG